MRKEILLIVFILMTNVYLDYAASSVIDTEFDVLFDNSTCIIVGDENQARFPGLDLGVSYWHSSTGSLPTDSRNSCFRDSGINQNGDTQITCCPDGYTCNSENTCAFEARTKCSDFTTEDECNADSAHSDIAINELDSIIRTEFPGACEGFGDFYGDLCREYLDCKCEWDDSASRCNPRSNHKLDKLVGDSMGFVREVWDYDNLPDNIIDICDASGPPSSGKCTFEFTYEGSCQDGDEFITRRWTADYESPSDPLATFNSPDYCQDGSEIIPCERVVRLPFFNLKNVVITIIFLIVIYYFIIKKRK